MIGRDGSIGIHAHIERRVVVVGKAALGCVELIRGNTEVDQCAVDGFNAVSVENGADVGKIIVFENDAVGDFRKTCGRGTDSGIVLVDADQFSRGQSACDFQRVTTTAERTVDINAGGINCQSVHTLGEHDGIMGKCGRVFILQIGHDRFLRWV